MMKEQEDRIKGFLSGYPVNVRDIAQRLRRLVRSVMRDAREELDRSARIIGFSLAPGYAGLICTVIPSKRGVKLGIARSTQLPDPQRLLEGRGKQHRYIAFESLKDFERPGIEPLLRDAVAVWRKKSGTPAP
jgi:hypothetical protein